MCLKFQLAKTSICSTVAKAICWASTKNFSEIAFSSIYFNDKTSASSLRNIYSLLVSGISLIISLIGFGAHSSSFRVKSDKTRISIPDLNSSKSYFVIS